MNKIEELKNIKKMFDNGLLSESEYSLLKSEIVGNPQNDNPKIENEITIKTNIDSHSENNTQEKEIILTDDFPVEKPHFNKMGVILFTTIIIALILVYQLHDKGVINFNNQSDVNDVNIKTLSDLENYINNEADSYCESWHVAITYNSEQIKHEEWVRLDGMILNFEIQIIPQLVKNNDLPDEYVKKAAIFFNERLASCGYYYYGGSPPEKKINELEIIEPVIIDNENDSGDISEVENSIEISNDDSKFKIGEYYKGGIIIYLDNTNEHGIICSNVIITDRINTLEISKQKSVDYFDNGGNWRLPSKSDFKLISNLKNFIDLKNEIFWTSNEDSKYGLVYESDGNSFIVSRKEWQSSALIFVKNF